MIEGLKRAGRDLTREKLVAALEGMNKIDLGDFVASFSPTNHSGSKFVDLTMIGHNGKYWSGRRDSNSRPPAPHAHVVSPKNNSLPVFF
jgi:ABC-type branched-subunit amino acid transport system substrate-binding protein